MWTDHSRGTIPPRQQLTAVAVVAAAWVCAAGTLPAPATAMPTRVGEWRFDESGGQSAVDTGPNALHGQLGSSELPDAEDPMRLPGLVGGALHFNGTSFVRLPDRSEFDVAELTAEAVVRASTTPGRWRYLVSRGSRECFAGSYGLYTGAAGGIAIYVFDGSRFTVSATARPADVWDGNWHHVAGTFDGRLLRLFVDGRPVGDPIASTLPIDYRGTSPGANFGRFVGHCDLAFQGDIDLVRLWSGAVSPDALAAAAGLELASDGNASLRNPGEPLPAAAPPTIIDAAPGGGAPPGADTPARACVLRLSRTRITAARRRVVRVRVELRGRPAGATRVIARRPGRAAILAVARTGTKGWARLVIDARRLRRVRISAPRKAPCSPVHVRVSRSR